MRTLTYSLTLVVAGLVAAILAVTPMSGLARGVVIELAGAIVALALIVTIGAGRIAEGDR